MAKNLSRHKEQAPAMSMGAVNMEAKAASGNLMKDAAYDAPLMNNQKRQSQMHMGNMPKPASGKF